MQVPEPKQQNALIISFYTLLMLSTLISCSPGKKPSTDGDDQSYPYRIDLTQHTKSNLSYPPGSTHPAFYNKENNLVYEISNFVEDKEERTIGIQNDLDGGPALIWQFTQDDQYAYCVHQAINLIAGKEHGEFDRIDPKLPEKKRELNKMIEQLKPEDNPVIMRIKLRH